MFEHVKYTGKDDCGASVAKSYKCKQVADLRVEAHKANLMGCKEAIIIFRKNGLGSLAKKFLGQKNPCDNTNQDPFGKIVCSAQALTLKRLKNTPKKFKGEF